MNDGGDGGGRTLLLVEDDPVLADALARALARRGLEVVICSTVAQARRHLTLQRPPHCALLDLRLPDGSGLSLVQAVRQSAPRAAIVVMTGFASIATAIEAIKLGASDYLCKPLTVDSIVAALEGRGMHDPQAVPAPVTVPEVAHEHIQRVLVENRSNISATARALGMHRRTLQRRLSRSPDLH